MFQTRPHLSNLVRSCRSCEKFCLFLARCAKQDSIYNISNYFKRCKEPELWNVFLYHKNKLIEGSQTMYNLLDKVRIWWNESRFFFSVLMSKKARLVCIVRTKNADLLKRSALPCAPSGRLAARGVMKIRSCMRDRHSLENDSSFHHERQRCHNGNSFAMSHETQ